jgi:hypothetical protein
MGLICVATLQANCPCEAHNPGYLRHCKSGDLNGRQIYGVSEASWIQDRFYGEATVH